MLSSGVNTTHIYGNLIGTTAHGDAPLGNGTHGLYLGTDSWSNEIGPGNVVSANGVTSAAGDGIVFEGTNVANNVVWGNIVTRTHPARSPCLIKTKGSP